MKIYFYIRGISVVISLNLVEYSRTYTITPLPSNSILFPYLHSPAAEDKTLPFEFQSPLSILLLSAGIICTWKQYGLP